MCDPSNPKFHDKELAREYLESLRWPDGAVCPHCGGLPGGSGKVVEADETFGNERKPKAQGKTGHGYQHKSKVLSLLEPGGKVRSFHAPNATAAPLKPYLTEQIDSDSRLMTDEASQYTLAGREFAKHGVVNHGIDEYVRGDIHTNTVEGYFSIFKRGLKGSFHHISQKHLKRYLCEFYFRYNRRHSLNITDA